MAGHTLDYRPLVHNDGTSEEPQGPRKHKGKRFLVSVVLLLPTVIVFGLLLALCLAGLTFSDTDLQYGCDPNGNVWVTNANKPNLWATNYGLAITLGFGKFSFSTAKFIDIAWDTVIGRGGQVAAGGIIYYVFRGPVVAAMESNTVPYEKVVKMQYHPAGTTSFLTYAKDVHWKGRRTEQWYAAFMLALTTLFVLAMPTWLSAMTGYQPIYLPLLRGHNNTYIAFEDLTRCIFIIQDGDRAGLGPNACVPLHSKLIGFVELYIADYATFDFRTWTANAIPSSAANINSTLTLPDSRPLDLPPPVLNITLNGVGNGFQSIYYEGQYLTAPELMKTGMCAPQKSYRWGFSLILLFMFLGVLLVLSIMVYVVAVKHFWKLYPRPPPTDRVFGELRTPLALAEAVREELGDAVAERLSDDGLNKALRAKGAGMKLRRQQEDGQSLYKLNSLRSQARSRDSRASSFTAASSLRQQRSQSQVSFL